MNLINQWKFGAVMMLAGAASSYAAITGVNWAINNSTRTHVFTRGTPIVADTVTTTGAMVATTGCSVVPALPAGITLNYITTTTCVLSGTPTTTSPTTIYHVHFRAAAGVDSVTFLTLTVGSVTNLKYPKVVTGTVGRLLSVVTPSLGVSSGTMVYSADSALPTGMTLASATGVIAGTPTAAFAGRLYVITATNGTDTTRASIRIEAKAAVSYTAWSGHKVITVNPTGLNLGAPVTNFPVLVRLTGGNSDVFVASRTGADVRFTGADSVTPLSYQIERWDSAAKQAEVWVNLPSVSNTLNTTFIMHYGMSGQTSASSGPSTFPTANNFQGVWHMNGAASANELDATGNAYNATPTGTTSITGTVGAARAFDGSSYLTATGTASGALNFGQNTAWTISTWVTTTLENASANRYSIVTKSNNQYALQTGYNTPGQWETVEYTVTAGRSGWPHAFSPADSVKSNVWTHVVGISNGGALYSYVNGNLVGGAPSGNSWDNSTIARDTLTNVAIGGMFENSTAGLTRGWNGNIDEVEISNVARDSNWVRLSYATQRPNTSTVSVAGTVGILPASRGAASGAFSVAQKNGRFLFSLPEGAQSGRIQIADIRGRQVWSMNVTGNAASWNGLLATGKPMNQGTYLVRFVAQDARTWEMKLAYAR